jgi:hypothetical protein
MKAIHLPSCVQSRHTAVDANAAVGVRAGGETRSPGNTAAGGPEATEGLCVAAIHIAARLLRSMAEGMKSV